MTPETTELLSRYLDDDLDQEARRELEAHLVADQALRNELESLRRIRGAVRELAATDKAPAALDRLVGHLERSTPPIPRLRPALRIAAIAATLVIGTAVVLRISQRSQPQIPRPAVASNQVKEKDEARAAPSPAGTPLQRSESTLQEVDRLVSQGPSPTSGQRMRAMKAAREASGGEAPPSARSVAAPQPSADNEQVPAPAVACTQETTGKTQRPAREPLPSLASRAVPGSAPPATGRPVRSFAEKSFARLGVAEESAARQRSGPSLRIDGRTIPLAIRPPADLPGGSYSLRLTVNDNERIVVARSPIEGKNAATERRRATALDRTCALLTGTTLPGVAPGDHEATLVVPPRSTHE